MYLNTFGYLGLLIESRKLLIESRKLIFLNSAEKYTKIKFKITSGHAQL